MLTLVRSDGLHPMLAIELARRGRVWGEFNAATLQRSAPASRRAARPRRAGSLAGLHGFLIEVSSDRRLRGGYAGYRRLAAPAP
jgi:hypothetical protein